MKKIIIAVLFAGLVFSAQNLHAYSVVDSVKIFVDRVEVYKKNWIPNYSIIVKSPGFTGTYMGPISTSLSKFVYCRHSSNFNAVCNIVLSYGVLLDTIPIVFAGNPGTWIRDLPKALQPCYTAGVTLAHFGVEGTKDFALPGEQIVVELYTVGSLKNVFSSLRIVNDIGNPVSNLVFAATSSGGVGAYQTVNFTLSDTLQKGKEYYLTGYINCGVLPVHPNIWFRH